MGKYKSLWNINVCTVKNLIIETGYNFRKLKDIRIDKVIRYDLIKQYAMTYDNP